MAEPNQGAPGSGSVPPQPSSGAPPNIQKLVATKRLQQAQAQVQLATPQNFLVIKLMECSDVLELPTKINTSEVTNFKLFNDLNSFLTLWVFHKGAHFWLSVQAFEAYS